LIFLFELHIFNILGQSILKEKNRELPSRDLRDFDLLYWGFSCKSHALESLDLADF